MEISMISLARMTLFAFFLGIGLGFLYDVVRVSRVMIGVRYAKVGTLPEKLYERKWPFIGVLPKNDGTLKRHFTDVFVFAGDILYCTSAGVIFCIFIYYANNGIFRLQCLAAAVFGFFCYYQTFGRVVITFAEYICFFLKIFVKILLFAIAFPFKIMYNILIKVSNRLLGAKIRDFRNNKRQKDAEKQECRLVRKSNKSSASARGKERTKNEKVI